MDEEFVISDDGILEKYNGDESIVLIPEDVKIIAADAFEGCKNILKVITNSDLKVIDDYAFDHCSSLKVVELNDGLERIGFAAFDACSSLMKINIPKTVKDIGMAAFDMCAIGDQLTIDTIREIQDATAHREELAAEPTLNLVDECFEDYDFDYDAFPLRGMIEIEVDTDDGEFYEYEIPMLKDENDPLAENVRADIMDFIKSIK